LYTEYDFVDCVHLHMVYILDRGGPRLHLLRVWSYRHGSIGGKLIAGHVSVVRKAGTIHARRYQKYAASRIEA